MSYKRLTYIEVLILVSLIERRKTSRGGGTEALVPPSGVRLPFILWWIRHRRSAW